MESDELRFEHVGLSSDGAVIFCAMDNGQTFAMPVCALETAEDYDAKAKPKSVKIIHDGYAAVAQFDNKTRIDFPSDFVQYHCDPSYAWHKSKTRAASGVGARLREIREARGLTLDALAVRCGIAKPNLSRLENDKVTPTYTTINGVARALRVHPALITAAEKPEQAWTWTLHQFIEWKRELLWDESTDGACINVSAAKLVKAFLSVLPEHKYARRRLLKFADPDCADTGEYALDGSRWARMVDATPAKRG